jgi:peptidoglycan/LPS O-acetylase OafA/YrhL
VVSSLLFGTDWLKYWYWFVFFGTNVGGALHQVGHKSLVPLWSLAVEEQFYLVWPWIVLGLRRNTLLGVSLAILIAAPIMRAIATPWFDSQFPIHYLTPFRMDLLASGAILAWAWRWNPTLFSRLRFWPQVALIGAAGLLIALGLMDPGFRTGANTVRGNVFIYSLTDVMAASLVTTALIGRGLICRFLRNPLLRYVGTISYSMYLIHQSALILTGQIFHGRVEVFGLAFALTILYATASWFGFERRLLSGGGVLINEKPAPIPA